MCFVLYAGTATRIPERPFRKDAPDLSVRSLGERDASIANHFKSAEVQYIGSTSGCGCDFPHVTLHKDEWVDVVLTRQRANADRLASEDENRMKLVELLRETGEAVVELYGVWDGDFGDSPRASEEVSVDEILNPDFYFKERGFYRVKMERKQQLL